MNITDALSEIFDKVYDARLELVHLLNKKGIKYPADMSTIDEWGTVRILGQYTVDDLDEYTVEEVEHLRRKKGKLITSGNVPSIRDGLTLARLMTDSRTNCFNKKIIRDSYPLHSIPDGTTMTWTYTNLSDRQKFSIGIAITPDNMVLYSMDGGMSWDVYELPVEDVASIQSMYSYTMQMMLFLVKRKNSHISLYGATLTHDGLREAVNLDVNDRLSKYTMVSLPDSSSMKLIAIRNPFYEDFLIVAYCKADNDDDPLPRIIRISMSPISSYGEEYAPLLTNGFGISDELLPIGEYGKHFFLSEKFAQIHTVDCDASGSYEYLLFHRADIVAIYKLSIDTKRQLQYEFIKEVKIPYIASNCQMTASIKRGINNDAECISIRMSDTSIVFIDILTGSVTHHDDGFIGYDGCYYISDGNLVKDGNIITVLPYTKIYPCFTPQTHLLLANSLVEDYAYIDDMQYTSYPIMYAHDYPMVSGSKRFTVCGTDGEMITYNIFANDFADRKNQSAFISYDNGDNWSCLDLGISIVGCWVLAGYWFICDEDGFIHYRKIKDLEWNTGAQITESSVGIENILAPCTNLVNISLYDHNNQLYLQVYQNDFTDNMYGTSYGYYAVTSLEDLMDSNTVISLSTQSDTEKSMIHSYMDNDGFIHVISAKPHDWYVDVNTYKYESEEALTLIGGFMGQITGFCDTPDGLFLSGANEMRRGIGHAWTLNEPNTNIGNSSVVIDPTDGVERKHPERFLQYGSCEEICRFSGEIDASTPIFVHNDVPYVNTTNGRYKIHTGNVQRNTNEWINSNPITYNVQMKNVPFGVLSQVNESTFQYNVDGIINTITLDEMSDVSNVVVREVDGFFAIMNGSNEIVLGSFNGPSEFDRKHIVLPSNTQVKDCVLFNHKVWFLLKITIGDENRVYIYGISIENILKDNLGLLSKEYTVFPETSEMCYICNYANGGSFIQRGRDFLLIKIGDTVYTTDTYDVSVCEICNEFNILSIDDIIFDGINTYFMNGGIIYGYTANGKAIIPYYGMIDEHGDQLKCVPCNGSVFTAVQADNEIIVYEDGLSSIGHMSHIHASNNPDAIIASRTDYATNKSIMRHERMTMRNVIGLSIDDTHTNIMILLKNKAIEMTALNEEMGSIIYRDYQLTDLNVGGSIGHDYITRWDIGSTMNASLTMICGK